MVLNTVNLTFTEQDSGGGATTGPVVISPSSLVTAAGQTVVSQAPIIRQFSGGTVTVTLVATDNTGTSPAAGFWAYNIQLPGQAVPALYLVAFSNGASQQFSNLTPVVAQTTYGPAASTGFSNPMTTLGDIIYENATPVAARLAGDTSNTRKFLREQSVGGVAQAPAWDTLVAGDVPGFDGVTVTGTPTAGQYPRASSGAAAAWSALQTADIPSLTATFTFGASGAAPSSGTYTTGQILVDQNGIPRVCTAGGTPGTWRRVMAPPWEFWIDDYGAKGDGKLALVNVTTTSAVINTTPVPAPAAPTLATATTGGTVLAGTYTVGLTYVNKFGETVESTTANITTTGSTSTITISPPAPGNNARDATGWYSYVSQAGGGTRTRQQAAGVPTAFGLSLVLTAPPTNTGATPPASDSSAAQVFTSTAVDGGKNYMICGAGGAVPGGPQIGTIASVQSPTQATLDVTPGGPAANGCAMVFSSDDRLAIDNCLTAARAYAMANNKHCVIRGADKIYGLGTGLFQSVLSNNTGLQQYNTQVRLPAGDPSDQGDKFDGQFWGSGAPEGAHCQFWLSPNLNVQGTALVSYSVGPNSSPDPTYGQQSIMAGPQGGLPAAANTFWNAKWTVRGITLVQPGWSNSIGLDLNSVCECDIKITSTAFAPSTNQGGGINPYSAWFTTAFWVNNKIAAGVRLPNQLNNDQVKVDVCVQGLNIGVLSGADHVYFDRLSTNSTDIVIKLGAGGNNSHEITGRVSAENYNTGLSTVGGTGSRVQVNLDWDAEVSPTIAGNDVNDPNNELFGELRWNDLLRSAGGLASIIAPVVTGAANLRIRNNQLTRQVYNATAYAYTLGTAFQNPWWEDAWIQLAGGTVTNIQIGPTSATATTSLATATPVTFKLPTGWWLNISGSVKPTTFIAVPD